MTTDDSNESDEHDQGQVGLDSHEVQDTARPARALRLSRVTHVCSMLYDDIAECCKGCCKCACVYKSTISSAAGTRLLHPEASNSHERDLRKPILGLHARNKTAYWPHGNEPGS